MEQPALLRVIRTENLYRFRLDLPDGPPGQEHSIELTTELRERLRRALQMASQSFQGMSQADPKRQSSKNGTANDAILALGRFLFDMLLPEPLQEAFRHLTTDALIISTNTYEIPWELMVSTNELPRDYLCQALSIGRMILQNREPSSRTSFIDRPARKPGKRDTQGLSVLFLVNPTGERPTAEEEVASLCTSLPESISRIILYRQQANQLDMRIRMNAETLHVLHYAGPNPIINATGEPALALTGNSRLDATALEQLLQGMPKRSLVFFLSHHAEARTTTTTLTQQEREEQMEQMANNLMTAGASAVITMRWPIMGQQARDFMSLFYQDLADGLTIGEALRHARLTQAEQLNGDSSWATFLLYGDPTQRVVASSLASKERPVEPPLDPFDESQLMSPLFPSGNMLDRRFLRGVLEFALGEARRMHKDYLGTPHLFIALTKLDGGCTQDALRNLGFSSKQVRDVIRLALGNGKAASDTPILPTRRCKEILQTAERNAINAGSPSI